MSPLSVRGLCKIRGHGLIVIYFFKKHLASLIISLGLSGSPETRVLSLGFAQGSPSKRVLSLGSSSWNMGGRSTKQPLVFLALWDQVLRVGQEQLWPCHYEQATYLIAFKGLHPNGVKKR